MSKCVICVFTCTACYSIGLLTVLNLAFLFSDLVKDGRLFSKFTWKVKRSKRQKGSHSGQMRSIASLTSLGLVKASAPSLSPLTPDGSHFKITVQQLHPTLSQYDVSDHILMSLQCSGPWQRQRSPFWRSDSVLILFSFFYFHISIYWEMSKVCRSLKPN